MPAHHPYIDDPDSRLKSIPVPHLVHFSPPAATTLSCARRAFGLACRRSFLGDSLSRSPIEGELPQVEECPRREKITAARVARRSPPTSMQARPPQSLLLRGLMRAMPRFRGRYSEPITITSKGASASACSSPEGAGIQASRRTGVGCFSLSGPPAHRPIRKGRKRCPGGVHALPTRRRSGVGAVFIQDG